MLFVSCLVGQELRVLRQAARLHQGEHRTLHPVQLHPLEANTAAPVVVLDVQAQEASTDLKTTERLRHTWNMGRMANNLGDN